MGHYSTLIQLNRKKEGHHDPSAAFGLVSELYDSATWHYDSLLTFIIIDVIFRPGFESRTWPNMDVLDYHPARDTLHRSTQSTHTARHTPQF